MQLECFTVGTFQVNTYLITDEATGQSAIVDTGDTRELIDRLKARTPAPNIVAILLTHAHIDHAGALKWLQEVWDVPAYMPRAEQPMFDSLPTQGNWFGAPALNRPCGRVDHLIEHGDTVRVGELELEFVATPGHTPGQGCYRHGDDIIVGDTLFRGSIGRTDFPMSDPAEMTRSLRRLFKLPPQLRVHSGHGPVTTLGEELATNPHLRFLREEQAT